uniref:Uncharacterized protein n=1 Tax=Pseudictyota dubia TaxID=2749911 RepID=A0A7R9WFA6_9STRA
MMFLRPLVLFSLASLTASAPTKANLRNGNLYVQTACPETAPTPGDVCTIDEDVECGYIGQEMPTYNEDGSCSGPFTCTPTFYCTCFESVWHCYTFGLIPCKGNEPGKAFDSCDP